MGAGDPMCSGNPMGHGDTMGSVDPMCGLRRPDGRVAAINLAHHATRLGRTHPRGEQVLLRSIACNVGMAARIGEATPQGTMPISAGGKASAHAVLAGCVATSRWRAWVRLDQTHGMCRSVPGASPRTHHVADVRRPDAKARVAVQALSETRAGPKGRARGTG